MKILNFPFIHLVQIHFYNNGIVKNIESEKANKILSCGRVDRQGSAKPLTMVRSHL